MTIFESFAYNALGQVVSHTNGKGQITRLSRNARGLPTRREDAKGKAVDNLTRRFSYNLGGHLTQVEEIGYGDKGEQPRRSTFLERDPIGRLLAKLNDDARQDYAYDDGDR
ncbi:Rhs family protein, partial [Pseudomonas syringae pv. actinidiae ICMP 18807]